MYTSKRVQSELTELGHVRRKGEESKRGNPTPPTHTQPPQRADWAKRLGRRVKGRPEGKRDQHSKMAGFHREGQPKPWAREV